MLSTLTPILAENTGEVENFPLVYQITCIVLTALFMWTFSIARDPRGWRRLYQAKFQKAEDFSVNKNKQIDERIKKYGIIVAMTILLLDVSCFVYGATYRHRASKRTMTKEELMQMEDMQKIKTGRSILNDSRRQEF